jgi:hypothetical protein
MGRRSAATKPSPAAAAPTPPTRSQRPMDPPPATGSPEVDCNWINYRPGRHPVRLGLVLLLEAAWVAFLIWMILSP